MKIKLLAILIITIIYGLIFLTNSEILISLNILSIASFTIVFLLVQDYKVNRIDIFSPINLVLFIFFIRLVIIPILILTLGYKNGVIKNYNTEELYLSYIIVLLFFIFFSIGWRTKKRPNLHELQNNIADNFSISYLLILTFFFIGFISVLYKFENIYDYLNSIYLSKSYNTITSDNKLLGFIALLGKFFFPFSVILLSLKILKSYPTYKNINIPISIILILITSLGTNRAAIIYPLLTYFSALIPFYLNLKPLKIFLFTLIFLFLIFTLGDIRTLNSISNYSLNSTINNFNENIQVYFGAPQFITPIIKNYQNFDNNTFLSSFFESFPQIGKSLRLSSGSYFYNYFIYKSNIARDQVLPTSAELFLNWGLFGLMICSFIIGYIYKFISNIYESVPIKSSIKKLSYFYIILLFNATIFLSFSVLGQFFIYNSWPAIILIIFNSRYTKQRNL